MLEFIKNLFTAKTTSSDGIVKIHTDKYLYNNFYYVNSIHGAEFLISPSKEHGVIFITFPRLYAYVEYNGDYDLKSIANFLSANLISCHVNQSTLETISDSYNFDYDYDYGKSPEKKDDIFFNDYIYSKLTVAGYDYGILKRFLFGEPNFVVTYYASNGLLIKYDTYDKLISSSIQFVSDYDNDYFYSHDINIENLIKTLSKNCNLDSIKMLTFGDEPTVLSKVNGNFQITGCLNIAAINSAFNYPFGNKLFKKIKRNTKEIIIKKKCNKSHIKTKTIQDKSNKDKFSSYSYVGTFDKEGFVFKFTRIDIPYSEQIDFTLKTHLDRFIKNPSAALIKYPSDSLLSRLVSNGIIDNNNCKITKEDLLINEMIEI